MHLPTQAASIDTHYRGCIGFDWSGRCGWKQERKDQDNVSRVH
jgi:hypothetical protein